MNLTYQDCENNTDEGDPADRRPVRDADDGVEGNAGGEDGHPLVQELSHYVSS